jgi:hypothetical protein
MLNRYLVETGSMHLVHGLSLYLWGTKRYGINTVTGVQYIQSNKEQGGIAGERVGRPCGGSSSAGVGEEIEQEGNYVATVRIR